MSLREGASSAFTDKFELAITGKESHGAFPHNGFDAIAISAQVINALQSLVSRRLDPTRAKVLSVGTIRGGTKENIIAGRVTMTGTIRTFEQDTRQDLFSELERAASVARALGGNYELSIMPGYIPVVNDPALTSFVRQVGIDLLGEDNVHESPLEMGGEDFSCFAEKAPGCFFMLGGELPGEPRRLHHNPRFDVDERCLPIGAALLAETAMRFLRDTSQ
jgi:amidohydrolase